MSSCTTPLTPLRWTEIAALYAQDQWTITPKLTLNYGIRYEVYPAPYTDKTGAFRLDPNLPQTANIVVGGVGGNPRSAGINIGHGQFSPRFGLAYRLDSRTVIRSGFGITTDPESFHRFLRDQYPIEIAQAYVGTGAGTLSLDPNNNPITLTTGIPAAPIPAISASGFASLPITIGTNTTPANVHRGYIESWNLFIQRDLGHSYVANIGYVGTRAVRQFSDITLNAAPLPSGSTTCACTQWPVQPVQRPDQGLLLQCKPADQPAALQCQHWLCLLQHRRHHHEPSRSSAPTTTLCRCSCPVTRAVCISTA